MAEVKWYGEERKKEIKSKMEKNMEKACLIVESTAKQSMKAGTGIQYGKHRASSPGQPPAVDTGRLRASITHEVEVSEDITGRVGTNVVYSKFLEHGTSKMAARPFLFPALELSKGRIRDVLND